MSTTDSKKEQKAKDFEFYISVWGKREHKCENCGCNLGDEALTIFFDHILEKSSRPLLRYVEQNIMLLCLDCHFNKTSGNLSDKMIEFRQAVHVWGYSNIPNYKP